MKDDLIKSIKPNQANFEYCVKTGTINGSLKSDIERVMTEYHEKKTEILKASEEKAVSANERREELWKSARLFLDTNSEQALKRLIDAVDNNADIIQNE